MTSRPIALFVPALDGGGGERITLQLAPELERLGFEVDLVVGSSRGPLRAEVPDSVPLIDLGSERLRGAIFPLAAYLHRRRPQAILPTIEHASVLCLLAARIARADTQVIVRVANTLSQLGRPRPFSVRGLNHRLVRRLYPTADALVCCSHGMADDLVELLDLPRHRVDVIANPTVGRDLAALSEAPVDHPWFEDGSPPVILGVGKLREQKDFPLLIRSFALVREARDARLVILGEGSERPRLEALVRELGLEDSVDLPGFEPNPYRYMARASVFALSSQWEGLPGVLIEALACGPTVVSTDCPSGPREILDGGAYGRLVPPGDIPAFALALGEALDDQSPPPATAWQPYTARASAESYATLLRTLEGTTHGT